MDVSDLIEIGSQPKLQERATYSHMITIPSEVVSIVGLSPGDQPDILFKQNGFVILDFRREVSDGESAD